MSKYKTQYYIEPDTDTYWVLETLKEPDGRYPAQQLNPTWFYIYQDKTYGVCLKGSKTPPDNLIEITDNKKEMFLLKFTYDWV